MAGRARDVLEILELKRKKERKERALRAISAVLSTPEGREALWYFIDQTGMNAPSLWEGSSKINYNVAIRDFGQFMVMTMLEANENSVFEMQKAAWHRATTEALEDQKILEKER